MAMGEMFTLTNSWIKLRHELVSFIAFALTPEWIWWTPWLYNIQCKLSI